MVKEDKPQIREVFIDGSLEELARGMGHTLENDEFWVQGGLPGENLNAQILHRSKTGRFFGRTLEVLTASPARVDVPCQHFLHCGGCDFLHADQKTQHDFKRDAVANALALPLSAVDEVIGSPDIFHYRALAKFVVGPDGALGSYRPRSHEVVDMKGCMIHAPVIETVADLIRGHTATGLALRYVIIRASIEQAKVMVTLVVRQDVGQPLNALVDLLSARAEVVQVTMNINDGEGDALLAKDQSTILYDGPMLNEDVGGLSQKLLAGAFSQINPSAAARLYALVVQHASPKGLRCLDLYCGSGGISRALIAAGAASVHGVEASVEAVEAARASSTEAGLSFEAASVEDVLARLGDADLIVVNPPRKGLSRQVVEALGNLQNVSLIYVSCNPKSLARDLKQLKGFKAHKVTPVDMFPQTRHVETVVALVGA
jgi:23S rRNA (uracil1939-C5)-methyltransferase